MFSRPVVLRTKFFVLSWIVCSVLWLFSPSIFGATESVTLAWNPAPDSTIAGYKIHYGTASHFYSSVVTVGNTNQATISGLMPGMTYYFAATSYNQAGEESNLSNEASYTVPLPPTLTSMIHSAGTFGFTFSGNPGQMYVVEASTNLLNWIPVLTNMAPFSFMDTNIASFKRRFYRTRSL